jgi:hypothetical protein
MQSAKLANTSAYFPHLHNGVTKNNVKAYQFKVMLRTTIMTPVKPQISKFKADRILPSGL